MRRETLRILFFAAIAAIIPSPGPAEEAAVPLGSRRELFVDGHLIHQLKGASLKLHHPRLEGTAGAKTRNPIKRKAPQKYSKGPRLLAFLIHSEGLTFISHPISL